MKLLFEIIVWFWKAFSLPYRVTKLMYDHRKQQRADAKKLLEILRRKDEDSERD